LKAGSKSSSSPIRARTRAEQVGSFVGYEKAIEEAEEHVVNVPMMDAAAL